MKALAVGLWLAAWACLGLPVAGLFAARNGKWAVARTELVVGTFGAAGLALAGAVLW